MPLDKMKLASLVKSQSAMPPIPGGIKRKPAPVIGAPAAAPAKAAAPAAEVDDADLPQMVEEAAMAAEEGGDIDLEDMLADYDPSQLDAPPEWATDAEAWQRAAEAVGLGDPDSEARYDEPFAVAAYLYKMIGGAVGGAGESPAEESMESPEQEAMESPAHEAAESPEQEAMEHPAKPAAAATGGNPMEALLEDAAAEAETTPDPELMDMLADFDPAGGAPPAGVVDAAKWAKAQMAVDPDGAGSQYADPWAVVAHVYKRMGGKVKAAAPAVAAPPMMGGSPPVGL